jgi:hypothetical protein
VLWSETEHFVELSSGNQRKVDLTVIIKRPTHIYIGQKEIQVLYPHHQAQSLISQKFFFNRERGHFAGRP